MSMMLSILLNAVLHVTLGQVVVGVVKSLSADSMIETTPLSTNFWELTGEPQHNMRSSRSHTAMIATLYVH